MKHEETFLFPKCGFRREIAQDGESPTNSGPDQATNHYKIERSPSTWHKSLLPLFWPSPMSFGPTTSREIICFWKSGKPCRTTNSKHDSLGTSLISSAYYVVSERLYLRHGWSWGPIGASWLGMIIQAQRPRSPTRTNLRKGDSMIGALKRNHGGTKDPLPYNPYISCVRGPPWVLLRRPHHPANKGKFSKKMVQVDTERFGGFVNWGYPKVDGLQRKILLSF